jgi:hypothetical protein
LLHLVWDGQAWSAPEVIVKNDMFPEWPHALISGGNKLHVTWFTRNEEDLFDPDRSNYKIWYTVKTIDAPALAPLSLFTPIPTAAPTGTPAPATPTPSPTPLAPAIVQAPVIDGRPAWESRGLFVVSIALAPVLGLLALLIFVTSWRRRHHH